MNHKLPFALSALGLISLAIHQPAMASKESPALVIEITEASGGVQPPADTVFVDGVAVQSNDGKFFVIPENAVAAGTFIVHFTVLDAQNAAVGGGSFGTHLASIESRFAAQLPDGLRAGERVVITVLSDAFLAPVLSSFLADGIPSVGGPSRLTATPSNVSNLVLTNSFADPSAAVADVQSSQVGATVENAANAALATSANTVGASATVISQLADQSIATGEDSLAVAALATTTDQTTATATVDGSLAGIRINNDGVLSGSTSITVDDNALTATARGNNSTSALTATGANSGAAGNSATSPDNDATYPAPGPLVLTGDLLATGVQQLDDQSDVTATISSSTLGLTDGNTAGTLDAIGGGVSVNGNSAVAAADGNRLSLSLTDNLSGGDVDSTAYGLQTTNDTNVTATAGVTAGVDVDTITDSSVVVDANSVQAAATANRATASIAARPDGATDSVTADVEQFVRAQNQAVQIQANAAGTVIGSSSVTATGANSNIADNRLTAAAIGNEQTTSADLGAGVQGGNALIEGNQTLVLDGSDLAIDANVSGSTIGTQATTDTLAQTTVNDNTAIGQAIGNNAAQALGAFAGSREGSLAINQGQSAQGAAANVLSLTADVSDLRVGAAASTLAAPQLTVSGNQAASLVTLNRNTQTLGTQSGTTSAAGTTAVGATQAADSASSQALVEDLRIGVVNPDAAITGDPSRAAAEINATGNRVDAQAELNRSLQSLAGVSGSIGGEITLDTVQTANAAAGGLSDVTATLDNAGVGLYGGTETIDVDGGRFNLVVSGNALASQAQANLAQAAVGPVSGTVSLAAAADRLGAGVTQSATDTSVRAQNFDTGLGISEADPATSTFDADTDNVSVNVSDNSLQALSRQNSASIAGGAISGQVSQGDLRSQVDQTTSGAGITRAENSGVFAGITPAVGANDLGFGNAADSSTLTVVGNTVRADAADNLATVVGGGVNGAVGANAQVGALIEQSSSGSQVEALNSIIDLGANEQNDGDLGAGTGDTAVTVADNTVVSVASANNSTASLGGVSGTIAVGGNAGVTTNQTLDSQVTASTTLLNAGVSDASVGNVAGSGDAAISVSRNAVATAVSGNDSRVVDLGNSAASIDGTLSATTTQTVNANASMSANSSNLRIGANRIGELGTQSAVAVSVDGNDVRTSATANNSNVTGSVSGTLTGSVALNATQTLNGSAAGIAATSGSAVEPNLIGVQADTLGANASVSVAGNAVTSAVAGNRVLNNLSGASFSNATGTLSFQATQAINGNAGAAATGDLLSSVINTVIGIGGGDNSVLPAAAVSGNRLVANTVGNESSRTLNGLSGNFVAATQSVAMLDTQTTDTAVLVASVSSSGIGSFLISDAAVPTSVAVNGNQVLAQSIANSSSQLVSLNGVSTSGGPLTSLNASQNLLNTTVRAEVSNVGVGLNTGGVTAGAGSFTGAAVASGNTVNATAIGNQSSLVRSGR